MFEAGLDGCRPVDVALPASPVESGLVALLVTARRAPRDVGPRGAARAATAVDEHGPVDEHPAPEAEPGSQPDPSPPPHSTSTSDSVVDPDPDPGPVPVSGSPVAGARVRTHAPTSPDWVADHPLAAHLDGLPPDADLAGLLASLEAADVDDAALVEAIAGWERVISWATSRQGRVIAELTRRRLAQGKDQYVGDEIAARLATTRPAAEAKVGLAGMLDRFPAVDDALARGDIDTRKATVITEEVMGLPEPLAQQITDQVLPDAPDLTGPRIRARIRRLEITADPTAAHDRHCRARADRHVTLTPARDAMAWLGAYLPADHAMAVYTTLTAVADSAPPDDPRPIDARRADALVDLATRWLDAGATPDGPLPTRQHRHPHLNVTATATTLLGLDENPGELAGYGPIPADMARRIAARATWRPLLADARTGELTARGNTTYRPSAGVAGAVVDRDVTCTFRECRVPAHRCQIDHIVPFDPALPAADQTTVGGLQAKCTHHHQAKTHGGWTTTRDPATGITTWTAPTGHTYTRPPHALLPPEKPRPTGAAPTPPRAADPPTDSGHPPDDPPRRGPGRPPAPPPF